MSSIKKIFAVIFAVMAVVLMSAPVFAADYAFTEQPQDVVYSGETVFVNYTLNFAPAAGSSVELWSKDESKRIHMRGGYRGCPIESDAAGKICYIKVYYGSGEDDYVESAPFFVKNGLAFTTQPQNVVYSGETVFVNYTLNFTPKTSSAVELWAAGETQCIHQRGGAQGCPIESKAAGKICYIKVYYGSGENDYIRSNFFKVYDSTSNESQYKFTTQPQDVVYSGGTAFVSYKLNFTPKTGSAVELWSLDEEKLIHQRGGAEGCPIESKAAGKTCIIKAYYGSGENDYVESDPFIVKDGLAFTTQPQDVVYSGGTAFVSYKLNFTPKTGSSVELWSFYDSKLIHQRGGVEGCPIESKAAGKTCFIKVYYGSGENDYITSDFFRVYDGSLYKFTTQPQSYTYPYMGISHIFSVSATNVNGYKWHILDENNNELTWDHIEEKGWGKLINSTGTSSNLQISDVYAGLDGKKIYCEAFVPAGYSIKSNTAVINVEKKIKYIYAEIENFENAVDGHNVEEFRKVTLSDNSYSTANDAQWTMFNRSVSDMEIYLNENYGIQFGIDAIDGYEFADSPICFIANVKGETITAARVTAPSTSTHQVFYFVYTVPSPENGIFIESTAARTLTAPAVGTTPQTGLVYKSMIRYEKYNNSVTWSPSDTTFQSGKKYTATITLTPHNNYYFDKNSVITINGKSQPFTIDSDGNAVVVMTFPIIGDIELDGDIDKADAALLLKYISGTKELTTEQYSVAFVNEDTNVDILDVIAILNKASDN